MRVGKEAEKVKIYMDSSGKKKRMAKVMIENFQQLSLNVVELKMIQLWKEGDAQTLFYQAENGQCYSIHNPTILLKILNGLTKDLILSAEDLVQEQKLSHYQQSGFFIQCLDGSDSLREV